MVAEPKISPQQLRELIAKTLGLPEMPEELGEAITKWVTQSDGPVEMLHRQQVVKDVLFSASPQIEMPIDNVTWVPIEKVESNAYNPNSVARAEMNLLLVSITNDGYTQPIVTVYDEERDKFVIIDGFHRYATMAGNKELKERCHGMVPVVVLNKDINDRMASTVRHNRARGSHSIQGMSSMVFDMLKNGWSEPDICNELGMSSEELVRLKHITGFSKLFKDTEYSKAFKFKSQIRIERDYAEKQRQEAEAADQEEQEEIAGSAAEESTVE